jgi:chaperone modulatory protein CbpM
MQIEFTEVCWVDEQPACSLRELAEASRLSEPELRELVELGVLHPLAPASLVPASSAVEPLFAAETLVTMRAVRRLREDLELDAHGVSVALALLERIEALERQLRRLRAQLPVPPG